MLIRTSMIPEPVISSPFVARGLFLYSVYEISYLGDEFKPDFLSLYPNHECIKAFISSAFLEVDRAHCQYWLYYSLPNID